MSKRLIEKIEEILKEGEEFKEMSSSDLKMLKIKKNPKGKMFKWVSSKMDNKGGTPMIVYGNFYATDGEDKIQDDYGFAVYDASQTKPKELDFIGGMDSIEHAKRAGDGAIRLINTALKTGKRWKP